MELRQLEHFVAVAEEGHFNRAAIRCHIVRSGLSASIRELERDLGTQLFLRTTREVRLTAAGQALLVEARRTLAAAASARGAVIEAGHHVRGPLSVGFSDGIRTLDVPALVANFHALYPAVTIAVVHGEPKTILDAVVSAAVDVAVTYLPARLPACLPLCGSSGIGPVRARVWVRAPTGRSKRSRACRVAGRDRDHGSVMVGGAHRCRRSVGDSRSDACIAHRGQRLGNGSRLGARRRRSRDRARSMRK